MKKTVFKTIGTTLIVSVFLFLAFGSGDTKNSSNGSTNSSSNNSTDWHTCSTCGKKFQGNGYAAVSDGVGGDLRLEQGSIWNDCKDCAQKDMDRMNEARKHKGYQGN